jgi:hypothetical protein
VVGDAEQAGIGRILIAKEEHEPLVLLLASLECLLGLLALKVRQIWRMAPTARLRGTAGQP